MRDRIIGSEAVLVRIAWVRRQMLDGECDGSITHFCDSHDEEKCCVRAQNQSMLDLSFIRHSSGTEHELNVRLTGCVTPLSRTSMT